MREYSSSEPQNGPALASLWLGIIAVLLSVVAIGGLVGIAALIVGLMAIRRPGRQGMAIAGIITGAIAIPMALICTLTISIMIPALARARATTRTVSNMRQLDLALTMYSLSNRGYLPTSLALVGSYMGNNSAVLHDLRIHSQATSPSPSTDWPADAAACDFYYAGAGLKLSSIRNPGKFIVLYDQAQRGRSRIIGFADGHAESIRASTGQLAIMLQTTNQIRQAEHLPPLPEDLQGPPPPAVPPTSTDLP